LLAKGLTVPVVLIVKFCKCVIGDGEENKIYVKRKDSLPFEKWIFRGDYIFVVVYHDINTCNSI
jgi:hypothetical protein